MHINDKLLSETIFESIGDCDLELMWIFSFTLEIVKKQGQGQV